MVRPALESDYYHAAQIEIERVSIFISRLEHIFAFPHLFSSDETTWKIMHG